MRLNLIAVLVEDHRGTAEHRCPLASEAAESLSFEKQFLAPDVLHNYLLR